jgi:hypothetical protein
MEDAKIVVNLFKDANRAEIQLIVIYARLNK